MAKVKPTVSHRRNTATRPQPVLSWLGLASGPALLWCFLLAAVLGSGLLVVGKSHENRVAFNQLQKLQDSANRLEVSWRQLLLEQSTFGVNSKIEDKAKELLKMQIPEVDDIQTISHD